MDSDSSDDSSHELGPKSPDENLPASPDELNSPPDSDDSDGSIASPNPRSPSPVNSPRVQSPSDVRSNADSPPRSSIKNSPAREVQSPSSDNHKSPPVNQYDDKGELSDSSSDSHSSDSRASSVASRKADSEELGELAKSPDLESKLLSPGLSPEPKKQKAIEITTHGADLSDVSDLESDDGSLDLSDEEPPKPRIEKPVVVEKLSIPEKKDNLMPVEEVEQLDFEAEEVQEKEDGECEGKDDKSDNEGEIVDGDDEGELKGDDLEEGEVTDDDENRPEETEPRPICRFYNRGQCTWGASCRFLHPGVTDKGNYTMFDMVRPLVPMNGSSAYPAMDYRAGYDRPALVPGRKEEPPVLESAWERGLRQAKEMMRKSTKRKETDMDFEEKKMNLSIGQEELDKENDYYTRPASPIMEDKPERWGTVEGEPRYREATATPRYDEYPEVGGAYYPRGRGEPPGWEYPGGGRRVQYEPTARDMDYHRKYRGGSGGIQHRQIPDYYDEEEPPAVGRKPGAGGRKHPAREVIVQRAGEKPWRDERYVEGATTSHRGRGDEWADPWMRSKSPGGRKPGGPRGRRQSYSSGSSYSSSSTTRSASSASSYSSYSHPSRSRSRSPKSRSPKSRSRSPGAVRAGRRKPGQPSTRVRPGASATGVPARKKPPPPPAAAQGSRPPVKGKASGAPAMLSSEKKAASERMLLMNPPAPSPRKVRAPPVTTRPPSPGMMRKSAQNPPPPLAGARATAPPPPNERSKAVLASALVAKATKLQHRLRPSRSTSGSESSGSSSDSSESSYSSSSSSREPTPKTVRPAKRIVIDERERLALAQKVKAMDALKLSGQKQQIKLTLKTPGSNPPPPSKRAGGASLPELPELNLVRRDRPTVPSIAGKKRPADGPLELDSSSNSKGAAPASKKATSRREELLKQLKAVEDAIARKRSKN